MVQPRQRATPKDRDGPGAFFNDQHRVRDCSAAGGIRRSLTGHCERAFGRETRVGPVRVDFDNLRRTPKASYHAPARAVGPET